MLEGVPRRQDDVFKEFPVGEGRDLVVRPEAGGQLPHGRGADAARVDPLGLDGHGVGRVGAAAAAAAAAVALQGSARHPGVAVVDDEEEEEDLQASRD